MARTAGESLSADIGTSPRQTLQRQTFEAVRCSAAVARQGLAFTQAFGARPALERAPAPTARHPVQRLVAVAGGAIRAPSIDEIKDPTVLTSIDFALTRTRGPVVLLREADFSGVQDGETIFITGHGSRGSVTGITGQAIGELLLAPDRGLRPDARNITVFFLSCYAASDSLKPGTDGQETDANSSVVATLSARLAQDRPGVHVVGGTGPTVKSNATGDEFNVIKNPNGTPAVKETLNLKPEIAMAALEHRYEERLQAERVRRREQHLAPEEPPIEVRARIAAEVYRDRSRAFLAQLKERDLVYDPRDAAQRAQMMRMYTDGHEVQQEAGVTEYIARVLAIRNH